METERSAERLPEVPDRSIVTAPAAREALDGILAAGWYDKRFGDLDTCTAWVLATLLRLYAEHGKPPSLERIGAVAGMSSSEIDRLLADLYRRDLAIQGDGARIRGAYPFTEVMTGHTVTFVRTNRSLNTMCVIDALGAGAMCREDTIVGSTCHECGLPLVAQIGERGALLGDVVPLDTVVWAGFRPSCGCAADSVCREIVPFCSAEHLDRWLASGRHSNGRRLTVEEAFQVGRALFADRALRGHD